MKLIGTLKKLDALGRLVIPQDLRRVLGINVGDTVAITSDGENVIIKKYETTCTLCRTNTDVAKTIHGKNICKECLEKLKNSKNLINLN